MNVRKMPQARLNIQRRGQDQSRASTIDGGIENWEVRYIGRKDIFSLTEECAKIWASLMSWMHFGRKLWDHRLPISMLILKEGWPWAVLLFCGMGFTHAVRPELFRKDFISLYKNLILVLLKDLIYRHRRNNKRSRTIQRGLEMLVRRII
jgi:hypothetical protein